MIFVVLTRSNQDYIYTEILVFMWRLCDVTVTVTVTLHHNFHYISAETKNGKCLFKYRKTPLLVPSDIGNFYFF